MKKKEYIQNLRDSTQDFINGTVYLLKHNEFLMIIFFVVIEIILTQLSLDKKADSIIHDVMYVIISLLFVLLIRSLALKFIFSMSLLLWYLIFILIILISQLVQFIKF